MNQSSAKLRQNSESQSKNGDTPAKNGVWNENKSIRNIERPPEMGKFQLQNAFESYLSVNRYLNIQQ